MTSVRLRAAVFDKMDHRFYLFFSVTLGFLAPSAVALLDYFQSHFKRKRVKLLELPGLALEQVLKAMDHRDVFMLSLCSKNSFKALKEWKTKVNWLCFKDDENELSVFSLQSCDTKDLLFSARYVSEFYRGFFYEPQVVRLTIGGLDVECLWKERGIDYIDTTGDIIQRALDNHIHQLFNANNIDLEVSANNIPMKNYRNISEVTDLHLYESTISPTDLEEILRKYHPNLKSVRVDGQISSPLPANSSIFNIENVFLGGYRDLSASFFWKNFKGRYVALGKGVYDEWDVIDFVNDWISGTEYRNLDLLFATIAGGILDVRPILMELSASVKRWDRPAAYEYWSRLIGTIRDRKEAIRFVEWENFVGCIDFERRTDQKMATFILLRKGGFAFVVWN